MLLFFAPLFNEPFGRSSHRIDVGRGIHDQNHRDWKIKRCFCSRRNLVLHSKVLFSFSSLLTRGIQGYETISTENNGREKKRRKCKSTRFFIALFAYMIKGILVRSFRVRKGHFSICIQITIA